MYDSKSDLKVCERCCNILYCSLANGMLVFSFSTVLQLLKKRRLEKNKQQFVCGFSTPDFYDISKSLVDGMVWFKLCPLQHSFVGKLTTCNELVENATASSMKSIWLM